MKATIALLGAALAASACTRVIERPVPTSAPSVVTTPAISERVVERSSASGATAAPTGSCMWNGQATSNGGISCQQGTQYRCNSGTWAQTALSCSPSQ
jgi:hypothetical protein